MARRVLLVALVFALLGIAVAGLAGCGSGAATTTTTVAATTTTTAPPATTGATPTTSTTAAGAAATTASSTAAAGTVEAYNTAMAAWVTGVLMKLDTSPIDNITDATKATSAQIDAVAAFVLKAQATLDQLKAITVPADLPQTDTAAHDAFLKAYENLVATTDKYVGVLRSKSASEFAAVQQAFSTAQQEIQQAVDALAPLIGLTPPTS